MGENFYGLFKKYFVEDDNYTHLVARVHPYGSLRPGKYNVPNNMLHKLYSLWLRDVVSKKNKKIFMSEHSRKIFNFFLDIENNPIDGVDFKDLKPKDIVNILKYAKIAILKVLEMKEDEIIPVIALRDINHFHVHYKIPVDKVLATLICDEIKILTEGDMRLDRLDKTRFVDTIVYANGIRILGSDKYVINKGWQNSIYRIVDNLDKTRLSTKKSISKTDMIKISTLANEKLDHPISFNETYEIIKPELKKKISKVIDGSTEKYVKKIKKMTGFRCEYRGKFNDIYMKFKRLEQSRCFINNDVFHDRSNFYTFVSHGKMIAKCFSNRCVDHSIELFDIDVDNNFKTNVFEKRVINKLVNEFMDENLVSVENNRSIYDLTKFPDTARKIIKYMNRHFVLIWENGNPFYLHIVYGDNNMRISEKIICKNGMERGEPNQKYNFYYRGINGNLKEFRLATFDMWQNNNEQRTCHKIGFIPGNIESLKEREYKKIYNIYHGFSITDNDLETFYENCDKFEYRKMIKRVKRHVFYVFCQKNVKNYNYFMSWMAHVVQFPHIKTGVAPVIKGDEGSGKTGFIELLFGIYFASHYITIGSSKQIVQWNKELEGKIVAFFDEAQLGSSQVSDYIKRVITEKKLVVEEKFVQPYEVENYINLIIASNHDKDVVNVERTARRFFILYVVDKFYGDREASNIYFEKLYNTDYRYFIYYLKHMDITDFSPRNLPLTGEQRRMKRIRFGDVETFCDQLVSNNGCIDGFCLYDKSLQTDALFELYKDDYGGRLRKPKFRSDFIKIFKSSKTYKRNGINFIDIPNEYNMVRDFCNYVGDKDWLAEIIDEPLQDDDVLYEDTDEENKNHPSIDKHNANTLNSDSEREFESSDVNPPDYVDEESSSDQTAEEKEIEYDIDLSNQSGSYSDECEITFNNSESEQVDDINNIDEYSEDFTSDQYESD